jgi:hypothetical protein
MALDLYDVSWGVSRLWCSSIRTDRSRTVVVHEVAEGDDHPTQDQGQAPRWVECELLFIEMPGERLSPMERFLTFQAQVEEGEPQLFTHPIDGQFYARVEGFTYTIDEDENITDASARFIRSANAESPTPAGAGTTAAAGEDAVAASAAEFTNELAAVGITSTLGADAVAAQEAWGSAEEVPTRQVLVDVAALSERLATMIVDEGLEEDLSLFGAYRAAILFGDAIRAAALAALAETPKLTSIRIGSPVSLLALCRRIYGGAQAEMRQRQILALNDIRTPAWIEAGTVLMIPLPSSSSARSRMRAA